MKWIFPAAIVVVCGCASMAPSKISDAPIAAASDARQGAARRPVLLVHGIYDTSRKLMPIRDHLRQQGWTDLELLELKPNDGSAPLPVLAAQVDRAAAALASRTGAEEIDVVAFSMGALVTRYWLKRITPRVPVNTFVSISGPHHGTVIGYFVWGDGVGQMRPNSPLLRDLQRDEGSWGTTRVFSFWTPLDLVIVPAGSSRLAGAQERTFPVLLHQLMVSDPRVLTAVAEALDGTLRPRNGLAAAPSWP